MVNYSVLRDTALVTILAVLFAVFGDRIEAMLFPPKNTTFLNRVEASDDSASFVQRTENRFHP